MKSKVVGISLLSAVLAVFMAASAFAGPPLTNAEGVGGVALNPFAYVANSVKEGSSGLMGSSAVSKPQLGIWQIGLTESDINWLSLGITESFLNRLEIGYAHEYVDVEGLENIDKDNISFKVNLLKEGDFGSSFTPAVSAGLIWKETQFDAPLKDSSDADYYVVATKMIGGLPVPVILNAGLLFTKGYVRGVLGFGDDRDTAFFGNIETVLFKKFIVGWEYEQGSDVGKVFKGDSSEYGTHSLWEGHVAYMYDDHLTLVASGAYTGDKDTVSRKAFGGGYVLSLQYAF